MGSPRHRGCCGIPASVSGAHPPQIAYTPQRRPEECDAAWRPIFECVTAVSYVAYRQSRGSETYADSRRKRHCRAKGARIESPRFEGLRTEGLRSESQGLEPASAAAIGRAGGIDADAADAPRAALPQPRALPPPLQ